MCQRAWSSRTTACASTWVIAEIAAIYLISFDGDAAVIDAGCGLAKDRLPRNIEAAGVKLEDIELLLITHCHFDHTGGARWLRDRLGERNNHPVHIPSHAPGSVAHGTTSAGQTIVYAQDVQGPLHPSLKSNAADHQASLTRLIDLDADVLREGRYGIFEGKQDIVHFVRSFMR